MLRLIFTVLLLWAISEAAVLTRRRQQYFTLARPGGIKDLQISDNTLNGTYHDHQTKIYNPRVARALHAEGDGLSLEFINTSGSGAMRAYVTGLDSLNRVVFVTASGALVYPSSGGSGVPVPIQEDVAIPLPATEDSFRMSIPIAISSGRVWFARGELRFFMVKTPNGDGLVQPSPMNLQDPSSTTDWGFAELTFTKEGALFANISFVDFVGLPLGVSLSTRNGNEPQTTRGLGVGCVATICNGMIEQGDKDGFPWSRMCVADEEGIPIRVLSPNNYAVLNDADFQAYWDSYVDQVWDKYSSTPLKINTQSEAGSVECWVSDDTLKCSGGDNRDYAKPKAVDIWGCNSGPFERRPEDNAVHVAIIPRLCAAFVRSTLLLDGGDVQPRLTSESYYTNNPASHYSRLIHELEVDGRGYAFPYDDVNPDDGGNASGIVTSDQPETLTIFVGAPLG
ncbi:hypothetical protein HIM_03515 [Hirsutella minnesotensis 3608]|uniref:GH64 domain-containing protein n=1 Tax=Hirsutella minnesotensis 3608 TaxID=1043627 RepID=A0A0F8A6J6_9HYPO|nr:hypothetical protein HIM_03515 [Hirsutella minnesotensis 3608]